MGSRGLRPIWPLRLRGRREATSERLSPCLRVSVATSIDRAISGVASGGSGNLQFEFPLSPVPYYVRYFMKITSFCFWL